MKKTFFKKLLILSSSLLLTSCFRGNVSFSSVSETSSSENQNEEISYNSQKGSNYFLVDFNSQGGTKVNSIFGLKIESSPISTKEGYTLLGWYIDDDTKLVQFPYEVNNNVTLKAKWGKNQYTCSFETNGGTTLSPKSNILVLEHIDDVTRAGYAFKGWHLKEDLSDDVVSLPLKLDKSLTLYADWEKEGSTPSGKLMAVAKVDAIEAKSYWSISYGEDALSIHANVTDDFLYGYFSEIGNNDNVEIVLAPKTTSLHAGFVNGNTHHFIVDINSHSAYQVANSVSTLGPFSSILPDGCSVSSRLANIVDDGFKGYQADFEIAYSLFGYTKAEALNNISMSVGMRNTNAATASKWESSFYHDYVSCWTYSLLKDNGDIENTSLEGTTLLVGGYNYSIEKHSNLNDTLDTYSAYLYSKDDELKDWEYKKEYINLYSFDKIIINVGRYDYYKGKLSNSEIVSSIIAFASYFKVNYGGTNVYVTSVEPLKNYGSTISNLAALNTSLSSACTIAGINYIDTYSLFIDGGGALIKSYFTNNFVFSSTGYTAYWNLIKTYL